MSEEPTRNNHQKFVDAIHVLDDPVNGGYVVVEVPPKARHRVIARCATETDAHLVCGLLRAFWRDARPPSVLVSAPPGSGQEPSRSGYDVDYIVWKKVP